MLSLVALDIGTALPWETIASISVAVLEAIAAFLRRKYPTARFTPPNPMPGSTEDTDRGPFGAANPPAGETRRGNPNGTPAMHREAAPAPGDEPLVRLDATLPVPAADGPA